MQRFGTQTGSQSQDKQTILEGRIQRFGTQGVSQKIGKQIQQGEDKGEVQIKETEKLQENYGRG